MACPRCGIVAELEVETKFGYTAEMEQLRIGDRYPWVPRRQPQNGGRPDGGNIDGQGYTECEHCHKDSFLRVIIREDVIIGIEPDSQNRGNVPD